MNATTEVVPNSRSNKWKKSWKRYFIELAYLHGYVMLYPNYRHFVSLSTNHLELGAHVKDEPRHIYEKKKAQFKLPLMPRMPSPDMPVRLLDLPLETMPQWQDLPILDLHGLLTGGDQLRLQGYAREFMLSSCTSDPPGVFCEKTNV